MRYINQNVDLFEMAVVHFGIKFNEIDRVDRSIRALHLVNGTVLWMPDDWNLS